MAGGEHAWDLITMHDQATASGLYLFTVEDKNSGQIKEGKFLIYQISSQGKDSNNKTGETNEKSDLNYHGNGNANWAGGLWITDSNRH